MPKKVNPKRVAGFPFPKLAPRARAGNFAEVHLGYSEDEALAEASRCILCGIPPCVKACPVYTDVRGMIQAILERDYDAAAEKLRETNCLPGTTARVCPQLQGLCESACVLNKLGEPVAIGLLQRFVADQERKGVGYRVPPLPRESHKKVAIVGAGPAGLAAADLLRRYGHGVAIFEALNRVGGTAFYGIPDYHLPKHILDYEIGYIRALGVDIQTGITIGRDLTIKNLFDQGFDAILIAVGPRDVYRLDAPGVELKGITDAFQFLMNIFLAGTDTTKIQAAAANTGKRIAVIGGGDTAVDAARTAVRLGAEEVTIVYRRSEKEMPADHISVEEAREEGVKIMFLTNPVRFLGDEAGRAKQMECVRMALGEPDDSGRRRPIPIQGSNFLIDVDMVILGIGRGPDIFLSSKEGIKIEKWGGITINPETHETSIPQVYAAGDVVTGESLVSKAMGSGRDAAQRIHEYLTRAKKPIPLYETHFASRYGRRAVPAMRAPPASPELVASRPP